MSAEPAAAAPYAVAVSVTSPCAEDSVPVLVESLRLAGVPMHRVVLVAPPGKPRPEGVGTASVDAGELTALVHVARNPVRGARWVLHITDAAAAGEAFEPSLRRVCDLADA